ncbi:hypothetical protein M436DRAFT_61776 [Aureobasidium namibiae CBS 147.97]|uniref:Uncharacterized protein n=1 Tax=Aureobasidium namibiae CBS 147.97 TaxID=1043004 RepID=A0A074WUY6_9PEZI
MEKTTRLQALLDERLAELRHEEHSLRTNMQKWVLLTGMNDHIKTQIPEVKDPIDLLSAEAQSLLNASSLVMHHDKHCVQVQARMNANYKRICEIFEEAQGVLDQLQLIDKDYQNWANLKGLLSGLNKPRYDWGMIIRKLASIIRQLG